MTHPAPLSTATAFSAVAVAFPWILAAQEPSPAPAPALERVRLTDDVYLFRAPGSLDKWTATNSVAVINDDGVLVLSEFAGAAVEMESALIVNPYDVDEVEDHGDYLLVRNRGDEERITLANIVSAVDGPIALGDFGAIALANNLLSALLDNHVHWGHEPAVDVRHLLPKLPDGRVLAWVHPC